MKIKKPKLITVVIVVLVIAIAVTVIIITGNNTGKKDIVIMRINGMDITQSVYKMYIYESAGILKDEKMPQVSQEEYDAMTFEEKEAYYEEINNFWNTEIEGMMPIEIVKDMAKESAKVYAYFEDECNKNRIYFEDTDLQFFRSTIDATYEDIDTVEEFDVEREFFLDYFAELERFSLYREAEKVTISVTNAEIEEYFNKNRDEYAKATVYTIFLEDKENENADEKKTLAYKIKDEILAGKDIEELVEQYSDFEGNSNGQFTVGKAYNSYSKLGGTEYTQKVINANEGSVEVLKTSTGYCINKIIKLEKTSEAEIKIRSAIQDEKFTNQVESLLTGNEDYNIEIINQEIYDSVKIPGIFLYE